MTSMIKDLCKLIAGYVENSSDMRSVDVPMLEDAFITKPPGFSVYTVCGHVWG